MAQVVDPAERAHRVPAHQAELSTHVQLPPGDGPFPASVFRTPYGRENVFPDPSRLPAEGVALVNQDVRGRAGSSGVFDMGSSDVEDGRRAVEWIRSQPWSDGRVAGRGLSYPGLMQWKLGLAAPEGLVCIAPMMAPAFWRGMNMREGGALQLALAAHWLTRQAAEAPDTPDPLRGPLYAAALEFEQVVGPAPGGSGRWEALLDRCLAHPALTTFPLANPARFLGTEPFTRIWRDLFHPTPGWGTHDAPPSTARVRVPTLVMGGWYDVWSHEATEAFRHLQATSGELPHKLVMAPYGHGEGWAGELPRPTDADRFHCDLDIRWSLEWFFDRQRELRDLAPVTYYAYNLGWRDSAAWPPPGVRPMLMHFQDGSLATEPPASTSSRAFTYDPSRPVPSRGGRTLGLPAGPCRVDDLAEGSRPDVVTFISDRLAAPMTVAGEAAVDIEVTSDVSQTDFTARLVDVFPDGSSYSVCDGICRTRFRDGLVDAPALRDDEPARVEIRLGSIAYTFLAGHRLRVDISSSNFPWYDLNLNADLPDGHARWEDARVAQQSIHLGPNRRGCIHLPVLHD